MTVKHVKWGGTTSAGGAATDDSPPITGEILKVLVDGTNLTAGADFDLNPVHTDVDGAEILGEDIIDNEDVGSAALNEFYPSRGVETVAGVARTYDGTRPVVDKFIVAGAPLRATIASGGNAVKYSVIVVYRD